MRHTFHLVPAETWAAAKVYLAAGRPYEAASLADEGFAHCTEGEAELGATFDRHYADDPRDFVALTLDLDALDVPWRYDVEGSPYPHIYGSIAPGAVVATSDVDRGADGRFVGLRPD